MKKNNPDPAGCQDKLSEKGKASVFPLTHIKMWHSMESIVRTRLGDVTHQGVGVTCRLDTVTKRER